MKQELEPLSSTTKVKRLSPRQRARASLLNLTQAQKPLSPLHRAEEVRYSSLYPAPSFERSGQVSSSLFISSRINTSILSGS